MDNKELIEKFYSSFSNGNAKGMTECYHENVTFEDSVFGKLEGEKAVKMWEMLLSKRTETTKISFSNVQATTEQATANWTAQYLYGEKKRPVTNVVSASFKFKDGKIIEHKDTFNLWKWTQQALGPVGYLIGWTPFMKNKIQKTTNEQLDAFMKKRFTKE